MKEGAVSHKVIGEPDLFDVLLLRTQARCLIFFPFLSFLFIRNIVDVARPFSFARLLLLHLILCLYVSHLIPSLVILGLLGPRTTILTI